MSEQAICESFTRELAAALEADAVPGGVSIALTLHERAGITARLSATRGGREVTYPAVSVSATDRGLRANDLVRLAGVAAQVLSEAMPDQPAAPAAPRKRM